MGVSPAGVPGSRLAAVPHEPKRRSGEPHRSAWKMRPPWDTAWECSMATTSISLASVAPAPPLNGVAGWPIRGVLIGGYVAFGGIRVVGGGAGGRSEEHT